MGGIALTQEKKIGKSEDKRHVGGVSESVHKKERRVHGTPTRLRKTQCQVAFRIPKEQ